MNTPRSIHQKAFVALTGVSLVMLIAGFSILSIPRVHHEYMRGVVAESGGWGPASFTVGVGDEVQIHLTSGDVQHGFAIGQMDIPAVDVLPGKVSDFTVTFTRPGKYVFYCTHWCGLSHWRMRGTIEVLASSTRSQPVASNPPLYLQLGLDIDAPHVSPVIPATRPSAARGAALSISVPAEYLTRDYYLSHSPAQLWRALRALPLTAKLSDAQVWDVVAHVWESNTSAQVLLTGKQLFAANCAACHGETGAGDGPMASTLGSRTTTEFGTGTLTPTNFTDPKTMLGASPALLQGKLMRGGMGTGMPYWGPVFTDPQLQALIDYLWTFQMEYQAKP